MKDIPETKQGIINYINYAEKEIKACKNKIKLLTKRLVVCEEKLKLKGE